MKICLTLFAALVLATGCASLPDDLQQEHSETWPQPEDTSLGAFIAETAPGDASLSGVRLLHEAEPAFNARYAVAAMAEKSLNLQYYLWKGDLAGRLLILQALDAADRGVHVRFLIDDIFHAGRDDIYAMLDAHENFEVRIFNPIANRKAGRYLNYVTNLKTLNHRMHNKIFMADNAVAVLGGRNIGNDYFGIDTKANFFDLDVLTTGQGAREAGAAFDEYWNSVYAVPIGVLDDELYTLEDAENVHEELREALDRIDELPFDLPTSSEALLERATRLRDELTWAPAHVVVDPLERFEGQGTSAIVRFNHEHIAETQEEIMVESAYLIPSKQGLADIKSMVDRGVRVRLLTNSLMSNNHISAHSAYLKYRKDILLAGAELHELRADAALREHFKANQGEHEVPAGIHTKSFILDENQALIGSFNFDPRSRELNSEIGLVIRDPGFAEQVRDVMEQDFHPENSYRLFLDEDGKLRWEETHADGSVTIHSHDPASPWWRRAVARFMSWLPIEDQM